MNTHGRAAALIAAKARLRPNLMQSTMHKLGIGSLHREDQHAADSGVGAGVSSASSNKADKGISGIGAESDPEPDLRSEQQKANLTQEEIDRFYAEEIDSEQHE